MPTSTPRSLIEIVPELRMLLGELLLALPGRKSFGAPLTSGNVPTRRMGLNRPQRLILSVLSDGDPLSLTSCACRCLRSTRSSNFREAATSLRARGYVSGPRAALSITRAGLDALGIPDSLPSGERLLIEWLDRLDNLDARVLRFLVAIYPETSSVAGAISGANADWRTTSPSDCIDRLRHRGLVEEVQGAIRASAVLMSG
jgi:hypothetical protein